MSAKIVQLLIVALIAAACGGGDDDAGTGDTQPGSNAAATSSTSPSDNGSAGDGAGSDTEFCQYLSDFDEQADQAPSMTNPAEVQALFEDVVDSLDQAQDLAPSEIEDDVDLIADSYDGFIEVLEENNYNFFALVSLFETDPRLIALDSPDFEEATDNIATFCGLPDFGGDDSDGFDAPAPTGTIDPGSITSSGELPDDFPANLEPPGVDRVESIILTAGFSVNIFTSASFDDLLDFYTDELGSPTVQVDAPDRSALWITGTLAVSIIDEGGSRVVNVTQTG